MYYAPNLPHQYGPRTQEYSPSSLSRQLLGPWLIHASTLLHQCSTPHHALIKYLSTSALNTSEEPASIIYCAENSRFTTLFKKSTDHCFKWLAPHWPVMYSFSIPSCSQKHPIIYPAEPLRILWLNKVIPHSAKLQEIQVILFHAPRVQNEPSDAVKQRLYQPLHCAAHSICRPARLSQELAW